MTTRRTKGGAALAGAVAVAMVGWSGADAAEPEDMPWTGDTCEAAFTSRGGASVLLWDDIYTHPGLIVSEALVDYEGTATEWKRANRIEKALPRGDGSAGDGGFRLERGETLALLIPCELTLRATPVPDGMNARSILTVDRDSGTDVWHRDLYPVWASGTDIVRRERNARGDARYEIK